MHAVGFGQQHGKGKHPAVSPDQLFLTVAVLFATVTDSWKSLFSLRLTPIFNLSNGAGLGKSCRATRGKESSN
jgi:hypothetical protein